MTVKELIKILSKFDSDLEIEFEFKVTRWARVSEIVTMLNKNT